MADQDEIEEPPQSLPAGIPKRYVEFRAGSGPGMPAPASGRLASPKKWYREGRGLGSEVGFLTADSVQRAIEALPASWAPYRLLVVTKVKLGRHYVEMVRVADPAQLDKGREDGEWVYFLWSPSLTPELCEPLEFGYIDARASAVLSLSGLPNIQYRHQFRGREESTRVGCVHKIRSYEGGELVLHTEYEKIYRSLHRALRKTRS